MKIFLIIILFPSPAPEGRTDMIRRKKCNIFWPQKFRILARKSVFSYGNPFFGTETQIENNKSVIENGMYLGWTKEVSALAGWKDYNQCILPLSILSPLLSTGIYCIAPSFQKRELSRDSKFHPFDTWMH